MLKRIIYTSLVLFGLMFCVATDECFADATAELEQAEVYLEAGNYGQAEVFYKAIVQDYPNSDEALDAQTKLAVLYITWEKQPEVKNTFEALLNSFSSHSDISEAVWEVCNAYLQTAKYEQAGEFFQYFLNENPQDNISIWLKAGLVRKNIAMEDISAAEALFQEMLSEYSVDDELLADVLINIGSSYFYAEQYEKANQLYKEAMNKGPDELDEMWAVMGLGMSNAALGNNAEADLFAKRLLTDFSDRADVSEAVYSIASAYFNSAKEYEKAAELYGYVSERWPDSETAIMAQAGMVRASIALGDYSAAQVHIEKLLTDFSDDNRLASALRLIADSYLNVKKYEEANQLYNQALDKGLEDADAIWAVMGLGMSNAKLGNHIEANVAVERLSTDFSWHPEVGMTLLNIAEAYWEEAMEKVKEGLVSQSREDYRKAAKIADIVEEKIPGFVPDAEKCIWTGICYRAIGKYEKSTERCQTVVDNWPDYEYAWQAQFLIGCNYEELKELGTISSSEADIKIKAAYEQLLEKYPNCSSAITAQSWLSEHNANPK